MKTLISKSIIKTEYLIAAISQSFFHVRCRLVYKERIVYNGKLQIEGRLKFLFDDSASKILFGKQVSFRDGCRIVIQKNGTLIIKDDVFFNSGCSINCLESIEIGEGTIFGECVKIYDHNHKYDDKTKLISDQGYSTSKIKIGRNCWIGSNVIILKSVKIGDGSIIGAGCLIFRDVEPGSVVMNKSELLIRNI